MFNIVRNTRNLIRSWREFRNVARLAWGGFQWPVQNVVSGVQVNERTALSYTALYAAVRIISETIATLPLKVYRELPDGGKEPMPAHPVSRLLRARPNPELTAVAFWETILGHVLTWGNGYAQIVRGSMGEPIELWLMSPDRTVPRRREDTGALYYDAWDDYGQRHTLLRKEVLHLAGLGFDGIKGYSPIAKAREAIGLGIAAEQHGAAFFGNGGRPGGVLKTPNRLKPEARAEMRKGWEALHGGPANAHRIAIMEQGLEWQQIGIPNDDAQFIESRRFQVQEIARIYRIPPHMLGDLERATFSNIEHQGLNFVTYTLLAWLVRLEQSINHSLLPNSDGEFYVKFVVDALLRGDTKSRYEAHKIAIDTGWVNCNEVREKEDLNRVEGQGLDEYRKPKNITGNDKPEPEPEPEPDEPDDETGNEAEDLREAFIPAFEDVVARLLRREVKAIKGAAKKHAADVDAFTAWARKFYEEHEDRVIQAMAPVAASYTRATGIPLDVAKIAGRHVGVSRGQLLAVVRDAEPDKVWDDVSARLKQWENERPTRAAAEEVSRAA